MKVTLSVIKADIGSIVATWPLPSNYKKRW
jgi:fructose 1,6-bisphosphatase